LQAEWRLGGSWNGKWLMGLGRSRKNYGHGRASDGLLAASPLMMDKPANTEHEILDLLRRRWSPRAFLDKPVPEPVLSRMFEAARWAASSFNEQPWTYILGVKAEDAAEFDRIAGTLYPPNGWAKAAPVLALSVARLKFSHDGSPNRVALHDVGAASAYLTIEGLQEGVYVHQMAGFDGKKAKEVFGIPDEFEPVAALAIGYPGDPESLAPALKEKEKAPRTRKKIEEFVYRGKWGGGAF
jgi:nitroreductase